MTTLNDLRQLIAYDNQSPESQAEFDRLIDKLLAERADMDVAAVLSDDAVDAALRVWGSEGVPPYMARSVDYLGSIVDWDALSGEERERRRVALHAAEREAEQQSQDLMRRAIAAAVAWR